MQDLSAKTALTAFMDRLSPASESVLLVDYDGTLAPFQKERDLAYPYPHVEALLNSIIRCGNTRVIVVTGRPIADLQTLFRSLNNLEVWGAHGLEHKRVDGTYQQTTIDPEVAAILTEAEQWLIAAHLTPLAEIKPGGVAIHWRGLPDAEIERIQSRVRKGWAVLAERPGIKLFNFEAGLELRVAHPDKGDAVTAILENVDSHAPIAFLGDDFTDEDAFRVLANRGISVLVRPEYRETRADIWLKPPEELIGFLQLWLSRISA
jgi:trehalose 6-phosphate phosphatase